MHLNKMKDPIRIAQTATVSAMVLGGECGYEIFYLSESKDSAVPKITAAVEKGLRFVGVIGLVNGSIETAAEPGAESNRIMQAAARDFLLGIGGLVDSKFAKA
jgi:formylmethanofuran:tetrahydromethanopterin formyltransferase